MSSTSQVRMRRIGLPISRGARAFARAATSITVFVTALALTGLGLSGGVSRGNEPSTRRQAFPEVLFETGFPSALKTPAQRIADVINGGHDDEIGRIDATGGDLKRFWNGYAELGTIVFRAFYHEPPDGFSLYDATSGMFSCSVQRSGARWMVTACVFNDSY